MIAQRTRRPRGATLVEFVVIFPIAVLLVLGLAAFTGAAAAWLGARLPVRAPVALRAEASRG